MQTEEICVIQEGDKEQFRLQYNAGILGLAIVCQAIKDWRSFKSKEAGASKKQAPRIKREIESCEQFFHSDLCELYCGVSGDYIFEHINEFDIPEFDEIIAECVDGGEKHGGLLFGVES